MIKAVITPLCISLLLGITVSLPAQTTPTDTAVQAAVMRQADQIALREKLAAASAAQQRRDLATAAKLYDDAWALVQRIGPGAEQEAQQTVAGLTAVRLELARASQSRNDLRDAELQVKDVLRVNPNDEAVIAYHRNLERLMAQQEGNIPSVEAQEKIPAIQKEIITAGTHVQNGRLYYEAGKYLDAEKELKIALAIDPNNEAAVKYLSLVQQAIFKQISDQRGIDSGKKLIEIEKAWNDPVRRESLPIPNPMAKTNLIYTSAGRQAIMIKLDRIKLDTVFYDSLPLSEVIRNLGEEVKKRDPLGHGINFLINPNPETVSVTPVTAGLGLPAAGAAGGFGGGFGAGAAPGAAAFGQPNQFQQPQAIDPTTGLPIVAPVAQQEAVDINSVSIKINPALNDVRLADVLEAIVTVADHPIKYSLTDYAVVFSLKGPETPQLHMRTFHVDPNTFRQGLESVGGLDFSTYLQTTGGGGGGGGFGGGGGGGGVGGGQNGQGGGGLVVPRVSVSSGSTTTGGNGGGGNQGGGQSGAGITGVTSTNLTAAYQQAVIQFFATVGVDLSPAAGKNVFFNDREGTLLVRATSQELDIIEAAIQTLNIAPPQINIKSKFVEISQNDTKAIGFDWYLSNFLMANGAVAASAGTAPSFGDGSGNIFPGNAAAGTGILPAASDQLLTSGLRNQFNAPAVASLTGILTDPQFRVVMHALQQRDGADLLNQSEVTTLSGRQAQMQVVDIKYIVTQSSVGANGGGGTAGAGSVGTTTVSPLQSFIVPTPQPIPLGPTLDVIPYVSADGYTIQMTIIPTIVEFVGYDDPGPFLIQSQTVGAGGASQPLTAVLPLPHFRVRQVTSSVIVWDGQTVVLGGLTSDYITRYKDQVPILGDLPWVGRFFRSESSQTQKKNLVIFITPTIIDPAGNRTHLDEDLPFAQRAVPTQPTSATSY